MSYTPFEPRVLPLIFFYVGIAVFSIYMTINMFQKWKQRGVNAPKYLAIVFLGLTLALTTLLIGLIEAAITLQYMEIYRASLPLSLNFVIIVDIFLFMFATEVVGHGRKLLPVFVIFGVVIIVLTWLPMNFWGVPSMDYAGQTSIRLYTTLGLVVFSYVIYFYIASTAMKAKASTNAPVPQTAFTLLFWAMMSLVGFFAMQIIDTLLIVFADNEGYSIFIYLAWFFAIAFYILIYLSLVMPDWLKNRIIKNA